MLKDWKLRIQYPGKLFFKNKGGIKTLQINKNRDWTKVGGLTSGFQNLIQSHSNQGCA